MSLFPKKVERSFNIIRYKAHITVNRSHVLCVVAVDDVQVSCYRILNSLCSLGTSKSIYVER